MLRRFLVLLWLANYLLVVGVGLVAARPEARYSAAHPYRHSADCQLRNALRLDCFDTCHGAPSQTAQTKLPPGTALHVLAQLKGVDLHCLPETQVLLAAAPVFYRPAPLPAARAVAVPAGFRGQIDLPPRRG